MSIKTHIEVEVEFEVDYETQPSRAKERTMLFLKNQYPSLNDDELSTFIDGDIYVGHK